MFQLLIAERTFITTVDYKEKESLRACAHSGQLMKQQIVMSRGSFSLALEIEFSLFIMICSFNRYTDAISKYESVMKTEPGVHEYTIRSKERICHCFSKVNC